MLYPITPERLIHIKRAGAAWVRMTGAHAAGARGPAREDVRRYADNMVLADAGDSPVGRDQWEAQALTAFTR
jgi:hypothetical protein